jgi:hypothetical protein
MRAQNRVTSHLFVYALVVVLSSMLVSAVYAVVSNTTVIQSSGAVKAIGVSVYWDAACTDEVTAIEWSTLEAGASEDKTVYIKNTGNAASTLFLDTDNWIPSTASQYLALTWDYSGQSISPDAVVEVVLTLTVSSGISGITDFSFDIIIAASG